MKLHQRKRWQIAEPISPATIQALGELADDLSPDMQLCFKQLLFNRGVSSYEEAQQYLDQEGSIFDPFILKDMKKAVCRLFEGIDSGEKIAVYGDYDVDGVTSTVVLVQAIRRFGGNASGFIPNRFEEGYGLGNETLKNLYEQGVSLVVTVDCGIRSPQEVEFARSLGLEMIITDHHEPKGDIPSAYAVINPKVPGEVYPERNLAGVGIAYKIVEAMQQHRPDAGVEANEWIDLVSIGTVADIVPLVSENRSMVKGGLKKIRKGARHGLMSLANVAGLDISKLTARDIAFVLGPRLNAAGRLDSAMSAYELMMTDQIDVAGRLAQQLDDQNRQRQEETRILQKRSEEILQDQRTDHLLFVAEQEFSLGLVGLVAAKLVDSYYLPAVIASKGEEFTRASCRSIEEFHITKALDECSHLLVRHGGHSMAAGFTVRNENLESLENNLREIAVRELQDKDLYSTIQADIEIPLSKLHPTILKYIDRFEPVGTDNPEILFLSRNVLVKSCKAVGADRSHLRMTVCDDKITYNSIAFRQGHWINHLPERIDIIYSYEVNTYQGRASLQLNIRDIQEACLSNDNHTQGVL